METSIGNEFIKVYDQLSKLQDNIAEVAKDCYEMSVISYDEINGTPKNLSDFNNDEGFITKEEAQQIKESDSDIFLKKQGESEQSCDIPTDFKELRTKTQESDDSSDNVATTKFVHDLVDDNSKTTISYIQKKFYNEGTVTKDQVVDILKESDYFGQLDSKIESAAEELQQNIDELETTVNSIQVPQNTSDLNNDSGFITSADIPQSAVTSVNGQTGNVQLQIPQIPTNVSTFVNDAGYITNAGVTSVNNQTGSVVVQENVQANWSSTSGLSAILNKPALKRVATTGDYNDLENTPELFSGDYEDLTNKPTIPPTMTILSYGNSTWSDFLAAYNSNTVVYCRASSNSNPATGSQTRMAFMAYVNNATNPTEVEFQYYRSVSSHSDNQQGDQVYVYKLNSSNKWTVTVRQSFTKVVAGTNMTSSWAGGVITLNAVSPVTSSDWSNLVSRVQQIEQSLIDAGIMQQS